MATTNSIPTTTARKPTTPPSRTPPPSIVAQKSPRAHPATTLSNASKAASAGASIRDKDDPIVKLDKKIKAINANNISRVANSHLEAVEAATSRLEPLLSLKTGRTIEKFPVTGKEVLRLADRDLDIILTHLEADRSGNEKEKRARLRMQIGLKPVPG